MTETFKQRFTPEERHRRLQKILLRNTLPIVLEECTDFVGRRAAVKAFHTNGVKPVAEVIKCIERVNACPTGYTYYVDDGITPLDTSQSVREAYEAHKDADGFLYLWYRSPDGEEVSHDIDPTRPYRDQVPFDVRLGRASAWREVGAVPLVCEPDDWSNTDDLPCLYDRVYSERRELTVGEFINKIRSRMSMDPTESLFLHVGDQRTVSVRATLGNLYDKYKDADNFLYLRYSREKTFG